MIGPRLATAVAAGLGGLAVVIASLAGGDGAALEALVRPPAIIRAGLVGASAAVGVTLLLRSLERLAAGTHDVPGMIRGVRLAFLAVAAASAGAGWALGDPLPPVVPAPDEVASRAPARVGGVDAYSQVRPSSGTSRSSR